MEKIIITKRLGSFHVNELDGLTFEEITSKLEFMMPRGSTLDYDYDGMYDINLKRLETEGEFQDRKELEKRRREKTEKEEKAQLEQLLNKYGNK